jgi:hypothetical protein
LVRVFVVVVFALLRENGPRIDFRFSQQIPKISPVLFVGMICRGSDSVAERNSTFANNSCRTAEKFSVETYRRTIGNDASKQRQRHLDDVDDDDDDDDDDSEDDDDSDGSLRLRRLVLFFFVIFRHKMASMIPMATTTTMMMMMKTTTTTTRSTAAAMAMAQRRRAVDAIAIRSDNAARRTTITTMTMMTMISTCRSSATATLGHDVGRQRHVQRRFNLLSLCSCHPTTPVFRVCVCVCVCA